MIKIEARPYGPDISEEDREALGSRVFMCSEDTMVWHEVPVQTVYQVEVMAQKMRELEQGLATYYLLIDLTEANRPSAEIINALRGVFAIAHGLTHASIFTGKNFLLNVAVKFVLERFGFISYSIHKTREEALKAIQNVKENFSAE